ncbi:MAG TPA: DUF4388 domain-containing protein [Sandaracinaceae bacterium LLY-WYZ-13_1]|nr:DUF4388 domain-containing protein [Sandaracinaceae bacterium LLY-WYZ-13_1]
MGATASIAPPIADDDESPFGVTDYVQLACMGQRCARVLLRRRGHAVGQVQIWRGELWSARDGRGVGEKALGRLMFTEGVRVHVGALHEDDLEERTIHPPWQHVLLEAARVHDEGGADAEAEEPPARRSGVRRLERPSVRVPRPADAPPRGAFEDTTEMRTGSFEEAFEAGVEALLSKRFDEAHAAFLEADRHRAGDPRVQANLERLRAMGFGGAR